MKTQTVHHAYTKCTPITNHTFCTLNVQIAYNHMYTYTKVFNKGSLLRFITKVLNNVVAKENFATDFLFFLLKNYRFPGFFAVTGSPVEVSRRISSPPGAFSPSIRAIIHKYYKL